MMEMVVGGQRLLDVMRGGDVVLYDTTGFIAVPRGGRVLLQYALVDLLRPTTVVILQRNDELELLLIRLRQRSSLRMIMRPAAEAAAHRSARKRRQDRAHGFAAHFEEATVLEIYCPDLAARSNLDFCENQLVVFTTKKEFVQALGRIGTVDRDALAVTVETPLRVLTSVAEMRPRTRNKALIPGRSWQLQKCYLQIKVLQGTRS